LTKNIVWYIICCLIGCVRYPKSGDINILHACSDVAHYLLDNYSVDVNGFRPGGKGILAKKVVESCKDGNLTVKAQ